MKILIIEDEELVIKSLEFRLRKDGYEVIKATVATSNNAFTILVF